METDTQELEAERSSRIRNLLDVQGREIERFDEDSLKLGFTTVVVTNYGDQVIKFDGIKSSVITIDYLFSRYM